MSGMKVNKVKKSNKMPLMSFKKAIETALHTPKITNKQILELRKAEKEKEKQKKNKED